MRLRLTHVEYINWKVKKKVNKISVRDELSDMNREGKIGDSLLVFFAVEKGDESVVEKVYEDLKKVAEQIKTTTIVLFPFVHLFPKEIADPEVCIKVRDRIKELLSDFKVYTVPFGWYKMHEYKCYGHPLSELSRTIRWNFYF